VPGKVDHPVVIENAFGRCEVSRGILKEVVPSRGSIVGESRTEVRGC